MKQKIINYLETDRAFATGKTLYAQLPGKSLAFNNRLNRMNDTVANCAILHYELAKLAGITERHLGIILRNPIKETINHVKAPVPPTTSNSETKPPTFGKGLKGLAAIKQFVTDNKIEVVGKKRADFDKAVADWFKASSKSAELDALKTLFINSDEKDKASVKLHDQFPFLSEDNCPDAYKILVADMVAAYRKYKAAHPKLFKQLTADERLVIAKDVVVNYKKNKQIWAELEYYQTNCKPLGNHPIIKEMLRANEIKAMNAADLAKLKTNLIGNINRNKKSLEGLEGKKADAKTVLITSQEKELYIVETELKTR